LPRALIIGDFHIPTRAREIPRPILERVSEGDFDLILCTGDLIDEETLNLLKGFGKRLYVVQGNMDYLRLPRAHRLRLGDFVVGLTHGDSIYPRGDVAQLTQLALQMDVDILISGHTHRPLIHEVTKQGRKLLLLNPGSATGVWSGGGAAGPPSFMTLTVEGGRALIQLYGLRGGRLVEMGRKTFER